MTSVKLYYCGCRCGCTTIIAGNDNLGCTFCLNDTTHILGLVRDGIDEAHQFNPLTGVDTS